MSLESASGEAHHLFLVPVDMAWNLGSVPCRMADLGRLQNPPDPDISLIYNGNKDSSYIVDIMKCKSNAPMNLSAEMPALVYNKCSLQYQYSSLSIMVHFHVLFETI